MERDVLVVAEPPEPVQGRYRTLNENPVVDLLPAIELHPFNGLARQSIPLRNPVGDPLDLWGRDKSTALPATLRER